MDNKEAIVVRAYVNFAGTPKVNEKKFSSFIAEFPKILEDFSISGLKSAISRYGSAFIDDIDPEVNPADIKQYMDPGKEVDAFFNMLSNLRLSSVVAQVKQFPFQNQQNKRQIKRALLTVYGQDPADFAGTMDAALDQDVAALGPSAPPTPPADPAGAPETEMVPDALPPMDENTPGDMMETLPPDVEEKALHTVDKFLIHDVFNNRIIPKVSITNAWKVQNGYVITMEFASTDGEKKAYTQAVIHNDTLILPAELTSDAEGRSKVGDFNKDTLLNYFAEQAGGDLATKSDNYTSMMDQMMSAAPVAAAKIMDRIIQRFGAEVGKQAFDTYTRVKYKRATPAKLGSSMRLEVMLARTLNATAHPELMDGERDDALRAIKVKLQKREAK